MSLLRNKGFTLIEVMVALSVFAAAASMLIITNGNSVRFTRYLQDKIQAAQVADQYLNKLIVDQYWSEAGVRSGVLVYSGLEWYVNEVIIDASHSRQKQVSLSVFVGGEVPEDDEQPVYTLISYIKREKE
ncbi:Type II secretion system protein I [invertebrate metagenome]|uniref:Type II secretion system protein I n=1 Tax=invertebrate metagenome TaxID=1711999 RepID=A0A2H9T5W9_9ZZZZ